MKSIIVKEYSRGSRLFVLNDDEIKRVNLGRDGKWYFDKDGITKGFEFDGHIYADCDDFEVWSEIDFKRINIEKDFFAAGYDRVIGLIDGTKRKLIQSRWKGQSGYYTFEDERQMIC